MHRGRASRAALALVLGLSLATLGIPTADAATTGLYRSQPGTYRPLVVDLGLTVTVAAGTTQLVTSRLVVYAAQITEVSHLVYCRVGGSNMPTERIVTGQNIARSTKVTLLTRALVTAPATGDLTCGLYAIFLNHDNTRVYGKILVMAGTNLLKETAPLKSSSQTWQISRLLVNSSYRSAPVLFTPVDGAGSIQAIGDVNVTVCHAHQRDRGACWGRAPRRSATYAYVKTRLLVQQLQDDGSVCRTFVAGPATWTKITATTHHRKFNLTMSRIPVSSSCTARAFRAYVLVSVSRSANSVALESNHQSQTALYVLPPAI